MTVRITDDERRTITRARELAALTDTDAMRAHFGKDDTAEAVAYALGAAQVTLGWLADLAERLGGGALSSRAGFDSLPPLPGHECSDACAEVGG